MTSDDCQSVAFSFFFFFLFSKGFYAPKIQQRKENPDDKKKQILHMHPTQNR